jgi:hypothetical protein
VGFYETLSIVYVHSVSKTNRLAADAVVVCAGTMLK